MSAVLGFVSMVTSNLFLSCPTTSPAAPAAPAAVLFLVSAVLGSVSMVTSILFLNCALKSNHPDSLFQKWGLPTMNYGQIVCSICESLSYSCCGESFGGSRPVGLVCVQLPGGTCDMYRGKRAQYKPYLHEPAGLCDWGCMSFYVSARMRGALCALHTLVLAPLRVRGGVWAVAADHHYELLGS